MVLGSVDIGRPRSIPPFYPALLWSLLFLFGLRVVGQAAVAFLHVEFLPPMSAWYSGLLSYPRLLAAQVVIVVLYAKICLDLTRGRGFFAVPRRWLGDGLLAFGSFYLAAMVTRYAVRMAEFPGERWSGGSIPTAFHWVLAAFLIVVGAYHRQRTKPRPDLGPAECVRAWPRRAGSIAVLVGAACGAVWLGYMLAPLPPPAVGG